eukprot:gene3803-5199_t
MNFEGERVSHNVVQVYNNSRVTIIMVTLRMLSITILLLMGSVFPVSSLVTTKMLMRKSLLSLTQSLPPEVAYLDQSNHGAVTRSVALSLTGHEHAIVALLADSSSSITAVSILRPTLDIFVNVLSFLFIVRTVLSWYPKTDLKAFPYNAV